MKEVKVIPSPAMELRIRISGQMGEDFRECRRLAVEEEDGLDCNACSLRKLILSNGSQNILACTFPRVREVIMEGTK